MNNDMTNFPPKDHRVLASRFFAVERVRDNSDLVVRYCQSCGGKFYTVNETKKFCNTCFHAYMDAGLYDVPPGPALSEYNSRAAVVPPLRMERGRVIDARGHKLNIHALKLPIPVRKAAVAAINARHVKGGAR